MAKTINNQLRAEISALRDKLCYYFLSAAGAAIGFVTTQISASLASVALFCSMISLVLFAMSFFWGWKVLDTEENLLWVQVLAEKDRKSESLPQETVQRLVDLATKKTRCCLEQYRQAQVYLLIAGAIVYAVGAVATALTA